eukprot:5604028-Amphidinium_carterae.1
MLGPLMKSSSRQTSTQSMPHKPLQISQAVERVESRQHSYVQHHENTQATYVLQATMYASSKMNKLGHTMGQANHLTLQAYHGVRNAALTTQPTALNENKTQSRHKRTRESRNHSCKHHAAIAHAGYTCHK